MRWPALAGLELSLSLCRAESKSPPGRVAQCMKPLGIRRVDPVVRRKIKWQGWVPEQTLGLNGRFDTPPPS